MASIDLGPDSEYLQALQAQAETEGYQWVVGALILNPQGEVFVQKRSPDRLLFPGCWDIVGGHGEVGESLYEALAREIDEETGWRLKRLVEVVAIFDWAWDRIGQGPKKREFDFLVEVEGDWTRPQIEQANFSEYRWVGQDALDILKENRVADDLVIFNLVHKALEISGATGSLASFAPFVIQ